MLTIEKLKGNELLKELSDDQLEAISTMSRNDEDATISPRIRDIYNDIDKDVLDVTGIEKQPSEKTYNYLKRVLSDFKSEASKVQELTSKVSELEKGNDATAQLQSEIESLKATYSKEKETWENKYQKAVEDNFNFRVKSELNQSLSGLKFKSEYEQPVVDVFIENATKKILSMNPEYLNVDGKEVLVFKDENGQIIRNTENSLNPYSSKEILMKELSPIIDNGRKQEGLGLGDKNKTPKSNGFSLTGAKTQVEAMELITQDLMKRGFERGTPKFTEARDKMVKESNVLDLPFRETT